MLLDENYWLWNQFTEAAQGFQFNEIGENWQKLIEIIEELIEKFCLLRMSHLKNPKIKTLG